MLPTLPRADGYNRRRIRQSHANGCSSPRHLRTSHAWRRHTSTAPAWMAMQSPENDRADCSTWPAIAHITTSPRPHPHNHFLLLSPFSSIPNLPSIVGVLERCERIAAQSLQPVTSRHLTLLSLALQSPSDDSRRLHTGRQIASAAQERQAVRYLATCLLRSYSVRRIGIGATNFAEERSSALTCYSRRRWALVEIGIKRRLCSGQDCTFGLPCPWIWRTRNRSILKCLGRLQEEVLSIQPPKEPAPLKSKIRKESIHQACGTSFTTFDSNHILQLRV